MTKVTQRRPFNITLPSSRTEYIRSDVKYSTALADKRPESVPTRFEYDHGNMLVRDKTGKLDLLFAHDGSELKRNACRILAQMSPDTTLELIRGYEIARCAGLLGDGKPPIAEVATILSTPYPMDSIADGAAHATDAIYDAIRLHLRKEGID
jgi:hypothetical protein